MFQRYASAGAGEITLMEHPLLNMDLHDTNNASNGIETWETHAHYDKILGISYTWDDKIFCEN